MRHFLLAAILLEFPLQIDKYYLHQDAIAKFGTIGGFNFSITTICLALLYLQWIPRLVVERKFPGRTRLTTSWPLVLYLGCVLFSLVLADRKLLTLFELFLLFQSFLLFLYIANHIRTRRELLFVFTFLILGLAVQGTAMMIVKQVGHDIEFGPLKLTMDEGNGRTNGTTGSPIVAASYMAMLIPTTLGLLLTPVDKRLKTLAFVALICGGIGLVLTQSRGSWLATGLSCATLLFFVGRRGWLDKRLAVGVCVAGLCLVASLHNVMLERILGDDSGSAEARVPLARMALTMIGDHPLGIGANNCATVALGYRGLPQFREAWFYTIHNRYLLVWLETGVLGLLAYLAFLGYTVRLGWQGWQRGDRFYSVLALGLTLAVVGQTLHMTVDVFNSRLQVQMLWLLAGLITAIHGVEEAAL